jgi:hypothetical protein
MDFTTFISNYNFRDMVANKGLTDPRRVDVRLAAGRIIIAESLSQHYLQHVAPTPLSGIRVGKRRKVANKIGQVLLVHSSSSSSSAYDSPLLTKAPPISHHLIRSPATRIQRLRAGLRKRHTTWPEGVVHYVYRDAVFTPELVYHKGSRFYGWYGQPTATSAY